MASTIMSPSPIEASTEETRPARAIRAITPDPDPKAIVPDDPPTDIMAAVAPSSLTTGDKTESDRRLEKAHAILKRYNVEVNPGDWEYRPKVLQERVNKNIRMRVKYTCHNCQTSFGHDKTCQSCQHRRCTACPRYPPRKERKRITRELDSTMEAASQELEKENEGQCTCHECQTEFVLGTEECPNCHHTICDRCFRESMVTENIPTGSEESKLVSSDSKATETSDTKTC